MVGDAEVDVVGEFPGPGKEQAYFLIQPGKNVIEMTFFECVFEAFGQCVVFAEILENRQFADGVKKPCLEGDVGIVVEFCTEITADFGNAEAEVDDAGGNVFEERVFGQSEFCGMHVKHCLNGGFAESRKDGSDVRHFYASIVYR